MKITDVFQPVLEADLKGGQKKFNLELPVIAFAGSNLSEFHTASIQWGGYFRFLRSKGFIFNQTDVSREFQPNIGIRKIGFLLSDGELSLTVGDKESETVFTERTIEDAPTYCVWPGAYLLERFLRDKGTSLTKLAELGKWFVEINTLCGQEKAFNAGLFVWQGKQQELRIAAAGARQEELLFTPDWPKPDFALDFGIRIS